MVLSLDQHSILFGTRIAKGRMMGKIPPNPLIANRFPITNAIMLWDEPVDGGEAVGRLWGKCHRSQSCTQSHTCKCVGIPYSLKPDRHGNTFTGPQESTITRAMNEIEERTCIRCFHIRHSHYFGFLKYTKYIYTYIFYHFSQVSETTDS